MEQVRNSELAIELLIGKLTPSGTAPASVSVRPDASHNPAIQLLKESSESGSFVVLPRTLGLQD